MFSREKCVRYSNFYLANCVSKSISFIFAYLSFHISPDNWYVMFWSVSSKGIKSVEECSDIRFITGIRGIVARDDLRSSITIKCRTYNSRLGLLCGI